MAPNVSRLATWVAVAIIFSNMVAFTYVSLSSGGHTAANIGWGLHVGFWNGIKAIVYASAIIEIISLFVGGFKGQLSEVSGVRIIVLLLLLMIVFQWGIDVTQVGRPS
jgi:hypothetical protein